MRRWRKCPGSDMCALLFPDDCLVFHLVMYRHVYRHVCTDMCVNMCTTMCMDEYIYICINMQTSMCIDMPGLRAFSVASSPRSAKTCHRAPRQLLAYIVIAYMVMAYIVHACTDLPPGITLTMCVSILGMDGNCAVLDTSELGPSSGVRHEP